VTTLAQLLSLLNAFNRKMEKDDPGAFRDTCLCFILRYNANYNLYVIPCEDLLNGYSPYIFKEPLFDDRLVKGGKHEANALTSMCYRRRR
jgi:hypothetical protein